MSLLMERKSTRSFTEKIIEKKLIDKLLISAMQAPSAHNQQPWEFIVVNDRVLLDKLSSASNGAWMLKHVNVAIVPVLIPTEASPHFAVQDMAAATENILLEATNLGIGSVWIGVYPLDERVNHVEKVLNIKDGKHPFSMIALGYPKNHRKTKIRYNESRVYYNKLEE
ncbi:MAG: nitroreductase family protein [Candidatus Izimaplasma sp.]|nr:nitroreductase family protein [Candidatus Izimaplasma bacterium]